MARLPINPSQLAWSFAVPLALLPLLGLKVSLLVEGARPPVKCPPSMPPAPLGVVETEGAEVIQFRKRVA